VNPSGPHQPFCFDVGDRSYRLGVGCHDLAADATLDAGGFRPSGKGTRVASDLVACMAGLGSQATTKAGGNPKQRANSVCTAARTQGEKKRCTRHRSVPAGANSRHANLDAATCNG
jgi:hypothetical protein